MTTGSAKPLSFEEGWPILQEEAINKLIHLVEGHSSNHFTSQEYMRIYTYPFASNFLFLFQVLPSIQGKEDEMLLHELVKRWNNHKTMTRWLLRFFYYLERYLIPKMRLPSLQETAYLAFYELVYGEMNDRVRDTVISLIDREREGEQIDQALVKNVLDIYVEMDEDSMKCYAKDFEESMSKDTSIFYSTKASDWIASKSYEDYMLKVEECLKNEEGRIQSYLRYIRKIKLLEVVEYELLTVHASKLEEKKQINVAAA
nr:cullin-1-like isoform X2 [Nicotiana tomentosiformis]